MIPYLVMVRGYPGAGKSSLAKSIFEAEIFDNCIMLDPDRIKNESLENFVRKYQGEFLDLETKKYRYNFKKTAENLAIGENVIWDQPFRTLHLLKVCVDRLRSFGIKFKLLIMELEVDEERAWERVRERMREGGHGPSKEVFEKMCKEFESADTDEFTTIKLDATQDVDFLIKEVENFLKESRIVKNALSIYIVRHLATKYNKRGIYMGRLLDPPILGEEKSSFVGTINKLNLTLPNKSQVLFVSSPALRCLQTIELLQNTLKINTPIQRAEEFSETNYGLFAGKTLEEIKEKFPEIFKLWMEKPSKVTFPEGETYMKVQDRAYCKFLDLVKNNQSIEKVFICTHVDVIKLILCRILSLPIKRRRLFRVDYGSFSCVQSVSGTIEVKFINFN